MFKSLIHILKQHVDISLPQVLCKSLKIGKPLINRNWRTVELSKFVLSQTCRQQYI